MEKWVCSKCGKEILRKPLKNEICNTDGCKGRYRHYKKCSCGNWFEDFSYCKQYCGDNCDNRRLKKPIKLKCCYCGKEFSRYLSDIKKETKNHFCSNDCRKKFFTGDKEYRKCKYCGKEFAVLKSTLDKSNATGNYCTKQCYYNSMKIESDGSYAGFRRAKKDFFSKQQFCAICGSTKNIHIHHIIPNRLTHDQSKGNLIPLCSYHHIQVEKITREFLKYFSKDYDTAKTLLNIILRAKQFETACVIKELFNENSKNKN